MPARKVSLESTQKKPSLASLMPDKTKGVAAQKRAINRIVASASKKTPSKKTAQNILTPKKKLVATRVKKVPVARKTTSKVVKPVSPDPIVLLTSSISIRAKEKSLVLLQALSRDFHVPAQKVALASGLCFITFGSYLSLAFSGALPESVTPQAALVSTTTSLDSSSTDSSLSTQKAIQPTFTLLEPISREISGVSKYTFSATNAKEVQVKLYSLSTGEQFEISTDKLVENTYRFTIDGSNLEPGSYVVKILLASSQDGSKYSFRAGEFTTKLEDIVVTSASTTPDTSTASKPDEEDENVDEVEVAEVPEESEELEEKVEPVAEVKTLTIKTLGTTFSGRTVLKAYAPKDTRFVEFYARPIKSTSLLFLGLAERNGDYWQYFFNSANIPNGTYELSAKTRAGNKSLESNSEIITISNYVAVATAPEVSEDPVVKTFEDTVAYESDNTRSFSEYSLFDVEASSSANNETGDIDAVLDGYRGELQGLLERYAVAQQSRDGLLVEIAKTELNDARARLVTEVLEDPNLSSIGDNVDAELSTRFEGLQKRIETFEQLRRVASDDSSSADTDADGISDFDELNLYRTNPEEPDSDNDGVNDGVEVMRGYDPLDDAAEAVIVYEMPQETFGLIENELLKVESVSPFVKTEDPTVAPAVLASIKGKGLPNSYVTIYVFSTPTIVTVRTDQDGSFEYTFEKELEDGEHEVYVAVTDNTGAIMARSNPFRFVKEAEAFTPIDAAGSGAPAEIPLYDLQAYDSYNIAIGLGILALGIILLMLGGGLKYNGFVRMTRPENDVTAT